MPLFDQLQEDAPGLGHPVSNRESRRSNGSSIAELFALPDIQKIRELVEMMVANDLIELNVRNGDQEITLRRPNPMATEIAALPASAVAPVAAPADAGGGPPPEAKLPGEVVPVDFVEIRSPMVGTFYTAPDPDSPSYVQVGSHVSPTTVVCILEAMKVFSEIKAETTGTIEKILVKNAEAVEYGQPLFLVRPV